VGRENDAAEDQKGPEEKALRCGITYKRQDAFFCRSKAK